MIFEEEDYDNFVKNDINSIINLNYDFNLNDRFVHVKDNEGNYFKCQTPFLKILKPLHITLNKKKTIAKKYIILETNDELDFNNQIGEFMFIINKIHEISQEKIRKNSMKWFNTEFDDIGLDIKVKRPIDQQKDNEFIKICINNDLEEISNLSKGEYILCNIIFKGLKISNDFIMEEWELTDFITQQKFDELQNAEYISENIEQSNFPTIQDEPLEKEDLQNQILEKIENENLNSLILEKIENEDLNNPILKKENLQITENIEEPKIIKKKIIKKNNIENKVENKIKNGKNELIKKYSKKIIFT